MPLKRKAVSATTDEPLSKRCTRSSGTLVEEKQAGPAYSGRTRLTVATPVRANRQPLDASPSTISWSTVEGIVESLQNENSEDELNLTPRPSRLGMHSRTTTPRMILHSVEIRVPSHISSLSPHIDRGSPIPPHRRCALGGTGDGLVTHTPPSSPLKNHYVPYGSRTNRNIASNTLQCVSPSKIDLSPTATASPSRLPRTLPNHLHSCLHSQKQAVLYALQHPQHIDLYSEQDGARGGDEMCTNDIALQQLSALLSGTVSRGEGNSCILLGPRGSGKTQVRSTILHSIILH
jgi:origin recognition complex subunit 4